MIKERKWKTFKWDTNFGKIYKLVYSFLISRIINQHQRHQIVINMQNGCINTGIIRLYKLMDVK